MPLYKFKCPECLNIRRKISTPEVVETLEIYCECRGVDLPTLMKRDSQAPSTQITETLDNGVMVRKLERLANAEEIFQERAHGKKGVI